jgi:hypothetical protein
MNDDTREFLQVGNYRIEKGVPLPTMRHQTIKTLRAMEPGDSVLIPVAVRASFSNAFRDAPGRFCMKREDDGHYRVFRME